MVPRPLTFSFTLASTLAIASCHLTDSLDDYSSGKGTPSSDSGASVDGPPDQDGGGGTAPDARDSETPADVSVDTGGDSASAPDAIDSSSPNDVQEAGCATITTVLHVEADTAIIEGQCNGTITHGDIEFAVCGLGRALARFQLGDSVEEAFLDNRVVSMHLDATRTVDCGGGQSCPATAGSITAYPLRSDWDEGVAQDAPGADWCRRQVGNPGPQWNASGADQDHGAAAAEVTVDAMQPTVSIELLPSAFTEQWREGLRVSLLLVPSEGTNFVFATREAETGASTLTIQYCE